MVRRPNGPSGQGSAAPGNPAVTRAVPATPALKVPATAIRTVASHGAVQVSRKFAEDRDESGMDAVLSPYARRDS